MVMAVTAMHEHMHQWAGKDYEEWQGRGDVGAVPDPANGNCKRQHHPAAIGREASEHGVMRLNGRAACWHVFHLRDFEFIVQIEALHPYRSIFLTRYCLHVRKPAFRT